MSKIDIRFFYYFTCYNRNELLFAIVFTNSNQKAAINI